MKCIYVDHFSIFIYGIDYTEMSIDFDCTELAPSSKKCYLSFRVVGSYFKLVVQN